MACTVQVHVSFQPQALGQAGHQQKLWNSSGAQQEWSIIGVAIASVQIRMRLHAGMCRMAPRAHPWQTPADGRAGGAAPLQWRRWSAAATRSTCPSQQHCRAQPGHGLASAWMCLGQEASCFAPVDAQPYGMCMMLCFLQRCKAVHLRRTDEGGATATLSAAR